MTAIKNGDRVRVVKLPDNDKFGLVGLVGTVVKDSTAAWTDGLYVQLDECPEAFEPFLTSGAFGWPGGCAILARSEVELVDE